MKKTLFILLGFILIISLMLVACKSTATTTSATKPATTTTATTTSKPATTGPTSTAPATTTTAAPTGDKYGGVWKESLTVGPSRPIGYPPEFAPDSGTCASPAVENLVSLKLDGTVTPVLATAWKIADDGSSITLTLRKGVKFHDGSDFNADVCKWNLDIAIAGKAMGTTNWKSVDKVDDYTVRINIGGYQNTALTGLAGSTPMVSKAYFEKNGIDASRWTPIGTGPFLFVDYLRDAKLTYKRNPNYWDTGKPYLDGVTMTVIADATVRKLAFQKGDIDRLAVAGGLDAVELQKAGYEMKQLAGGTFALVPCSAVATSPWANINVRFAASYALDRDALAKALGLGFLNPAFQLFPGYPDTKLPGYKGTPYDLPKAKDLLKQAGYPNGFKTAIHGFTRVVPKDYIEAVAGQMRQAGFDVTTDYPEAGQYDDMRYKGWSDGCLGHGLINYANHNSDWTVYFGPTMFPSLKRPTGWQEAVNASLASKEVDPKLMQQVVQIMADDMTVIPYTEQIQIAFYRKGVHDPMADTYGLVWPIFKECYVDKSAR